MKRGNKMWEVTRAGAHWGENPRAQGQNGAVHGENVLFGKIPPS